MSGRVAWAAAAGLTVAAAVALNLTASLVGVFYDDGIYLALAKSLAEGHGYRLLYLPGAPGAVHYPFLYPAFLAALWRVVPAFPANVALFKAANAVLLGLFAALLVLYLRWRAPQPTWRLALFVVVVATAVPLVTVATVLFAEPLFLVLAVGACWAADAARASEARRSAWALAAAAGALAGAAALTRSVGIAVIAGVVVSLLLARRPRAALIAALVAAAWLAPWLAFVARHHGDADPILASNYGTYGDLLGQAGWWLSPASLGDLVNPLGAVALAPFHGWLRLYLGVPALLLLAAGFAPLARARSTLGWSLIGYLVIVFAWPYGPDRFLWAVWPFLALAFAAGAERIWSRLAAVRPPYARIGRGCVAAVAAAVVLGYGFYQVRGYARGDAMALQRGISATLGEILPWIREATPPDAVVAGEDEALLWLYTGRHAVPNYVWRYRGRGAASLGPDSLRAWFDRAGVTQVLLTGPRSDAAPTLNRLLECSPGYLRLMRVWPGSVLAFAVERAAAGGKTP
ncbi:MAG TPA: hypothetical protein VMT21_03880 [Gemmatimonadales bacterium]|nr:hypothetical protein [Gemmatimonadales bacterium]